MNIFSIAVQYDATIQKAHFIKYKDLYIKYIPRDGMTESDTLAAIYNGEASKSDMYKKMSEFAKAYAYQMGYKVKVSLGYAINQVFASDYNKILNFFKDCTCGYCENRCFACTKSAGRKSEDFLKVSNIDTYEKFDLLNLYMDAFSNENVFFQILFFWHVLVYPKKDDIAGVESINNFIKENSQNSDYESCMAGIKEFCESEDLELDKFGDYCKENMRNSIAHIVRDNPERFKIDYSDLNILDKYNKVSCFLQKISKYKLDYTYNMSETAGQDIFQNLQRFIDKEGRFVCPLPFCFK